MSPENDLPRTLDKLRDDLPSEGIDMLHPFWMRGAFHVSRAEPGILYEALDRGLSRRLVVFRADVLMALLAFSPFCWIITSGSIAGANSADWIERAALVSLGLVIAGSYAIAFRCVRRLREQGFFFHLLLTPSPIQGAMVDIGCHAMRICLPAFVVALGSTLLLAGPSFLIILPALFAPTLLFQSGHHGAKSALRTIALRNLFRQRLALFLTFMGLPASAVLGGLFSFAVYSARSYWPLLLILLVVSLLAVVAMMYKAQAIRQQLDREFEEQMTTLAAFQPGSK